MNDSERLTSFGDREKPVRYIETMEVKEGVECDLYSFNDDPTKDLAVIRVAAGAKTPMQRVLSGLTTTEGHLAGKGTLTIQSPDGLVTSFGFDGQNEGEALVEVGQIMQWAADPDRELVFYEVCVPPYEDGRFEDVSE